MDKNTISMLNNLKSRDIKGKSSQEEGDVELFSKMLEERSAKIDEEPDTQESEEIYSDKKEKEKAEEQERMKRAEMNRGSGPKSAKSELYKLGLKDPASLSLSQKRNLGMETKAAEIESALSQQSSRDPGSSLEESGKAEEKSAQKQVFSLRETAKKKTAPESTSRSALGGAADMRDEKELPAEKKDLSETREAERNLKREEVIKQIIQHVELKNIGNKTELALKLNPEFLGEMKLRLLFDDDSVTAQFDTVSPFVRDAIEESQGELVAALKGKGVKVGKVSVSLVEEIT